MNRIKRTLIREAELQRRQLERRSAKRDYAAWVVVGLAYLVGVAMGAWMVIRR